MQSVQQSSAEFLEAADWTVQCESQHHEANSADLVDHGGPARFFVLGPCRHTTGYRCEPAALSAMAQPQGHCDRCRSFWPRERFTYYKM